MQLERGTWWRFLWRALVLGVVMTTAVFVGNKLANAGPGEPVRKALTVAGVLTLPTGMTGTPMATFRFFSSSSGTTPLCDPTVGITDRNTSTGAFSVEVPLDQAGHMCPDTMFHDPIAFVEVWFGEQRVVDRRAINPVPYAVYAQQYGTPDCPVGYERNSTEAGFEPGTERLLCQRFNSGSTSRVVIDEVVRVGSGASTFWVDRYESAVRTLPDDSGAALFQGMEDSGSLPRNGQWRSESRRRPPAYAMSKGGAGIARFITWFQALEACRASGKRLPTGEEWFSAAQGTPDPSTGTDGCVTGGSAPNFVAGSRSNCRSAWGAEDMVGNLKEWTSEWFASVGQTTTLDGDAGVPSTSASAYSRVRGLRVNEPLTPWPARFGDGDATWNVTSVVNNGGAHDMGIPATALRGGRANDGAGAGVFALDLGAGPSVYDSTIGFRCVIPR